MQSVIRNVVTEWPFKTFVKKVILQCNRIFGMKWLMTDLDMLIIIVLALKNAQLTRVLCLTCRA